MVNKIFLNSPYLDASDDETKILRGTMYNVPMRIYRNSKPYRKLIKSVVKRMKKIVKKGFDDYPIVTGVSGANIGIPLNIIVVKDLSDGKMVAMINPKIIKRSQTRRDSKTNCGSLLLEERVVVRRHDMVKIEYYDMKGKTCVETFRGQLASTIQHEIDHSNGILIIDRIKEAKDETSGLTR
jgi:peptide deformylase